MKIALQGQLVLLVDTTPQEAATISSWGMAKYDRRRHMIVGPCTLPFLDHLAELCRLPPMAAACRDAMKATEIALAVEREREPTLPVCGEYPVSTPMYQHQIRGANMALYVYGWVGPWQVWVNGHHNEGIVPRGYGLLYDMGCGKSLTAIAIMGVGWKLRKLRRVLVVSPASVSAVWPGELDRHAAFPVYSTVMQGTKSQRLRALDALEGMPCDRLKVAVINYESVWRDGIHEAICGFSPDMIICDESQRIKSHNAAQSKAMHALGDVTPYKLILSGTPVQNAAVDLWSQYRFLDASVFGTNFYAFRSRYCVMGGYNQHQIVRYKHMDELVRKEHSIAYRVTKEEALDLPEQIFETRHVALTEKEMRQYNQLRRESYMELENSASVTAPTVLTKLLRLQQFTGGFLTDDDWNVRSVSSSKLKALEDLITDSVLTNGHKLVIFARFVAEIHAIADLADSLLSPAGLSCCTIYGGVKQEERGEIVQEFQEDPRCAIFIGQIDTAGAGITLTAADTCVYYSTNFNFASYSQSLSRIHRIGQSNRCLYIHLVADSTVDQTILDALEKKQDLARLVVDGWRHFFI